jgi:septal ring factor EnvC (AmiA/AmiB activator)
MAQAPQTEKKYRAIGIAVAGTALLGWLLALYFISAASSLRAERDDLIAQVGTAEELDQRITALQREADQATAQRDENAAALAEVTEDLDAITAENAALQDSVAALQSERDALETALVDGRDELAAIETSLTETQDAVAEATQELAAIGERLQEGRQQEADLQSGIADLTAEVAQLTEDAAEAETRVQEAREAEASLEQSLIAAQQEQENLQATRDALQASVETLIQRREELAADALATEQQVQDMQAMTGDLARMLAERGEQLATLESRLGDLQQDAGARVRADAAGIIPNLVYMHRTTSVTFTNDGAFTMTNMLNREGIAGRYTIADDMLTFDDVTGDIGQIDFPLTCAVQLDDDGFTLADSDGSCAVFDGASFTRSNG